LDLISLLDFLEILYLLLLLLLLLELFQAMVEYFLFSLHILIWILHFLQEPVTPREYIVEAVAISPIVERANITLSNSLSLIKFVPLNC